MHQTWAVRAGRGRKDICAYPTVSPTKTARLLNFCACHGIEPVVEMFPMSQVNEALDRLCEGKVE